MSTPQVSRKRPFSSVGIGDMMAVCSPQTRRSTTLSSNSGSLYQSPLPEVRNEEDIREKKGKRRSRNFTASTGSPFARPADEHSAENGKLTNDQLASHYVNCIKLSTENKITAKNAFSLHLIDHMNEMLKQRCEGVLNFQMAGGTIFASAKIYASRVDAVHSETYKVMSSLGRGSNDDKSNEDGMGFDNEDEKKQPGKKKKKRSKILENNPSAIRLKQLELSYQADPLDQYYASVFDVANTSGLLINHLLLCKDGLTVRYHSEGKARMPEDQDANNGENTEECEKKEQRCRQTVEDRFADLTNLHKALKNASICQSHEDFTWDRQEDSQPEIGYADGNVTDLEGSQPEINMDYEDDDDDDNVILDSAPTDNEDLTFSSPIQHPQSGQQEAPLGMDEQLVTAFEPGEYSYFKPSAISTWEGPNHWKMKLHSKVPSAGVDLAGTENSNETGQANKRKKKKKFLIGYHQCNVGVDEECFQRLKKSVLLTRRIKEKLKSTKNDRLLPSAGEYVLPDIAKCNLQPIVLMKPISLMQGNRYDVDVDIDQLGMYNYDNPNDKNNYCPNATDDEDDFEPGDSIPANFATDYTAADSNASNFPDMTISQPQSQSQLDAMLKGDHLISHPRKIEKISIAYAKKATRIDVRKLKAAMWSVLKDQAHNSSMNTVGAGDVPSSEPDMFDPPKDDKTFTNLYYSGIQGLMPQYMAENLSIPLAFTCLLHLANEKSLCISADSAMSDLHIDIPESCTGETGTAKSARCLIVACFEEYTIRLDGVETL